MTLTLLCRWPVAAGIAALLTACDAPAPVSEVPASGPVAALVDESRITQEIAEVTATLLALDPSVDRVEAARAAEIAVRNPLDWARDWRVVDAPLVHNFKVVNGLRDKGVCQHFADAMHTALAAEGFRSLQIHRAMANARNLSLEHATVILTARGQPMHEGVILDPWRIGQGRLWFGRVSDDDRYTWETLEAVRAWREQSRRGH